jgi:hypothetical protein
MNYDKLRNLKIQILPQTLPLYETRILVISISPCQRQVINIEIRVEEWVVNWN